MEMAQSCGVKWGRQNEAAAARTTLAREWRESLRTLRIISNMVRVLGGAYYRLLLLRALAVGVGLGAFTVVVAGAVTLSGAQPPSFGLLFASALVGWACLYFQPLISSFDLQSKLRNHIRRVTLHVVHSLPLEALEPMSRGDWLQRVVKDLREIEEFLLVKVPRQFVALVVIFLSVGIAFVGLRELTGVLVVMAALLFLAAWWLEGVRRIEALAQNVVESDREDVWLESLGGLRTIHVHQAEAYFQRRFDGELAGTKMRVRFQGLKAWIEPLLLLGAVVIALLIARWDLVSGADALYLLFALPVGKAAWECGRAMSGWRDVQENLSAFSEQLQADHAGRHWGNREDNDRLSTVSSLSLRDAFWDTSEDWAGPLDWTINRGELWVLTGPSDSGKSALLEVLAGLRTLSAGTLQFKCDGETNANERVPVGLCAYVEQFPFIFRGSIRENLTFGSDERPSEAVLWRVLERVGLAAWAHELGGLDTEFQANGRELLKAEKYRIALGRALLLNRPFLLLDEPFAHFDDKTIRVLSTVLEEEKKRRGIIIVSRFIPKDIRVDGVIAVTDFETKRAEAWGSVTRLRSANPTPL